MSHRNRTGTGQRESELNFADLDEVRGLKDGTSKNQTMQGLANQLAPLIDVADNQNKVRVETTNWGLLDTDEYLESDASGGDIVGLLMDPSEVYDIATGVGQRFYLKFIFGGSTNKVSFTSSGGKLIDGDTEVAVFGPEDMALGIQSIGTAWRIVN